MNPDELRERLARAVEPIHPDPASFPRLRDSIARRRRGAFAGWAVGAVATAAVVAGVAVAVPRQDAAPPVADTSPTPSASPTPSPTPTPTVTPTRTTPSRSATPPPPATSVRAVPTGQRAYGDVDGDGRRDTAELVTNGVPQDQPRWRYGVRVTMTTAGVQVLWEDEGAASNEAQELVGVADLDRDGRAEVVVSPGGTASGRFDEVVTLVDGRIRYVSLGSRRAFFTVETWPDRHGAWGCRDDAPERGREVYAAQSTSADGGRTWRGTRTDYRLVRGAFVRIGSRTATWRGENAPAEYVPGIHCPPLAG